MKEKQKIFSQGLAAITTIIIVLGILIVLMTSYGLVTYNIARQTSNVIASAKTFYVAEAGAEDGIIRYQRSSGTLSGSWSVATLSTGTASVTIDPLLGSLESGGDSGGRKRKIKVSIAGTQVYTYAALIGDGGLHMSDGTFIKCVGSASSGCLGTDEAGDAGLVYVNGNVWANGANGGGAYRYSGDDARITGDVYVTQTVDIRPSERKEPVGQDKYVCLGAGSNFTGDAGCTAKVTAVLQKVRVREGGKDIKRAGMRLAFMGDPSDTNFPTATFYPLRENTSGNWLYQEKVALDKNAATTPRKRAFSTFALNPTGAGIASGTPEWVYFNIPSNGMSSVDDDTAVWFVLQVESPNPSTAPTNGNYWRVYYDENTDPGFTHSGGYGGYIPNANYNAAGTVCPPTGGGTICTSNPSDPNNETGFTALQSGASPTWDFHFRIYALGSNIHHYNNSLNVTGELHADEAIGATVVGKSSSSADKDNIGFVGRRFATTFWRDKPADQRIWGHSFVQQFDNCDVTGNAGTETIGTDLETRRGFRVFCDSEVRDVTQADYEDERRYSAGASYPIESFYCNPYKNAGSVEYSDSGATCGGSGNLYTPYEFNQLAESSGEGCFMACGSGTSCSGSDVFNSYYLYPIPAGEEGDYGEYPYNFCEYATGNDDERATDEADLKSEMLALGIDAADHNNYLPKAPLGRMFPISDTRIDTWIRDLFPNGQNLLNGDYSSCKREGSPGDQRSGDNAFTIQSNTNWTTSTCIEGDLVVRSGKLTLEDDTYVYVTGNLLVLDEPSLSAGEIEMDRTGSGDWDSNEAGLLIVEGVIDTERGAKLQGGNSSRDVFLLAISRSNNMGDLDPLEYTTSGGVNQNTSYNEGNQAAIYIRTHEDSGSSVSYYAKDGSVVMGSNGGGEKANALQISARKLIMGREAEISYDYGLLDMLLPGGPAQTYGVGDYDEINP